MKTLDQWHDEWPFEISTLGPARERERKDRFILAIQADARRSALEEAEHLFVFHAKYEGSVIVSRIRALANREAKP